MSLDSLLTQECTIQRATRTNSGGVVTVTYADSTTGVACLIQEKVGRIRGLAVGTVREYDAEGFFAPGTDIRPQAAQADNADQVVLSTGAKYLALNVVNESGKDDSPVLAYLRRVPQ